MRKISATIIAFVLLAATGRAEEIVVSAAASLTNALTDVAEVFKAEHPGIEVTLNFASSGTCFRQIQLGAPVDLFLSANRTWMQRALEENLVEADTVAEFARNSLVMAVPAANPAGLKKPADLAGKKGLRIAVGNPRTVPAGKYAEESLRQAGIWDAIAGELILAEDVRQVLDYLKRDEVDAGFVYRTDAVLAPEKVVVVAVMETPQPVSYPGAVVLGCAHRRPAGLFLDFLLSAKACLILRRWGFSCAKTP